ncbi:hypothetical protein PAECIP111893_05227 [Paenibacillus plantiphilus]|uniref:Uncharacterized protein n=1 Tax=Paenibacillus plantiphilus TaxID=2905650 RepID=A0ABM9CUU9_9BACL|nr:hypothetical protein PAECIP111893_05227 [Paenibacillus plantiphilus]
MKQVRHILTVLSVFTAAITVYFLIATPRLFDSEWLPGFISSLMGSIISFAGPFKSRKESILYAIISLANFLLLLWYMILMTPLAVLFFGP